QQGHTGMVPDGMERGTRVHQAGEHQFPELRPRTVREGVSAEVRQTLFRGEMTMEILTEAEFERFHADGYLKFRRVISDEQLESMRAALDRTIAAELTREDDGGLPPEFRYGHDRKGQDRAATGREARAIHQF